MPSIRIDDDVYVWLKTQAVPFDDTPNSVLRRLAGLDKRTVITNNESAEEDNSKEKGVLGQMEARTTNPIMPKRPAKYLARRWKVNVVHALYHRDGTYYNHLRDFPGALFDPNGYVKFDTEREYKNSPHLQHGMELNVPNGISSIPGYKRML